MSRMLRAARSFHSAVRAWPSSSMQVQTTAAPNSRARRRNVSSRVPGLVALLEVDRVEDGPAAEPLQRGPGHRALGGVDHERHARLRAEAAGDLGHVGHAVGAGVVDADVDEVRALLDLVPRHADAGVPVGRRAWPRGRPWSRWRWSARRRPGTTCPGRRGPRCRWRRRTARARGCAPPARRRRSARPRRPGGPAWSRSTRRWRTRRTRSRSGAGARPGSSGVRS